MAKKGKGFTKKKAAITAVILAAAGTAGFFGWKHFKGGNGEDMMMDMGPSETTVIRTDIEKVYNATGTIISAGESSANPIVDLGTSFKVGEVYVKVGDQVRAGDPLYTIDMSATEDEVIVLQRKLALQQAQNSISENAAYRAANNTYLDNLEAQQNANRDLSYASNDTNKAIEITIRSAQDLQDLKDKETEAYNNYYNLLQRFAAIDAEYQARLVRRDNAQEALRVAQSEQTLKEAEAKAAAATSTQVPADSGTGGEETKNESMKVEITNLDELSNAIKGNQSSAEGNNELTTQDNSAISGFSSASQAEGIEQADELQQPDASLPQADVSQEVPTSEPVPAVDAIQPVTIPETESAADTPATLNAVPMLPPVTDPGIINEPIPQEEPVAMPVETAPDSGEISTTQSTQDAQAALRLTQLDLAYRDADASLTAYQATYNEAKADSEQAKADYETAKSNREAAEKALEDAYGSVESALKALEATGSSVRVTARANYENQLSQQDAIESQRLTNEASELEAQEEINKKQKLLNNDIVYAAMDGVVTRVNVANGQSFTGSNAVVINDMSALNATVDIDEGHIADLEEGMKVRIRTEATGEEFLNGYISFIAPIPTEQAADTKNANANVNASAKSKRASYRVDITIENPSPRLRIGMTAKLDFILVSAENTLAIPTADIMSNGDGSGFVTKILDDEGNTEDVMVWTGVSDSYYTQIVSGDVEEGDRIQESGGFYGGEGEGGSEELLYGIY